MPSAERAGQGPETAGISPVPLNKGWTERPHLGWYRGLEERGTQASEPRTLSCRHPAPPTFCAGSRPALQPHNDTSPTTTPAQRQRSPAAPRCQGRECQGGPTLPQPWCPWPGSLRPPTLWGKSWPQDKCLLRECKLIEGVAL